MKPRRIGSQITDRTYSAGPLGVQQPHPAEENARQPVLCLRICHPANHSEAAGVTLGIHQFAAQKYTHPCEKMLPVERFLLD